jgi:hypothetical protein
MVQSIQVVDASSTTPEQALCDRGGDGVACGKPSVFAYLWDWGERGTCCAEHATLLQQIATQINRTVTLHPLLSAPVAAPLTRDERTTLKAAVLVIEEELEEVKSRGLELYRLNNELLKTNNMLTVREREARAQLKDREGEVLHLRGELESRDAEHGELVLEVERLRTLERMVNAPERNVID